MQPRIMYIENKGDHHLDGPATIGRVSFSKTGKMLYYAGRKLSSLKGFGYKANYFDVESGEHFWVTGCKVRGGDRLYPGFIEIDEDVRVEYWTSIRKQPERMTEAKIRCDGKYRK